jgi:hypothetical protein
MRSMYREYAASTSAVIARTSDAVAARIVMTPG